MWKRHTRNLDALEGSITSDRRAQRVVKHPAVRRAQKIKQKYEHTNKKQHQQKKLFLELFSAHLLGGIFSIYTPHSLLLCEHYNNFTLKDAQRRLKPNVYRDSLPPVHRQLFNKSQ